MSDAGGTRAPKSTLAALLACAATRSALDTLYASAFGDLAGPGYPLLVAGLCVAGAAVVALVAGRASVGVTLACWAGFETLAGFSADPEVGALTALVAGGMTLLFTRRVPGPGPVSLGVCLGCVLFLALGVAPSAVGWSVLPGPIRGLPEAVFSVVALAAALLALSRLPGPPHRGRIGHAPAAALLASLVVTAAAHVFAVAEAPAARLPAPPTAKGPNLLVLVLDTVRADHLSLYGYERETTPRLASFVRARPGVRVYPRAYSTSNWTLPAHVSLFTGTLPSEHQVHFGNGIGFDFEGWTVELEETLAGRLATAGYRSACVTANPYLMLLEGAGEGFDVWRQAAAPVRLRGTGELLRALALPRRYAKQTVPIPTGASVNRALLALLEDCREGGCFLLGNYMEAHAPYLPSAPNAGAFGPPGAPTHVALRDSPERRARAAQAYDEEILELDAHLGDLLDTLERRGFLDDLWLFITADHGEAFGEHHSVRHASSLYDEQVRIPLIVHAPGGASLPDASTASLLDVTATIGAIATGTTLGTGRDLRMAEAGRPAAQVEFFGFRNQHEPLGDHASLPSRAVVRGEAKLLEMGGRRELYDLDVDPREQVDRSGSDPALASELAGSLPPLRVHSSRIRLDRSGPDLETIEALRAIGYGR